MRITSAAGMGNGCSFRKPGLKATMNKTLIGIAAFAVLAASHPAFADNVNHGNAPRLFPKGNPTTVVHTDSLKRANTSITRPYHVVPEVAGPSLDDLKGRPPKVPCGQKVIC
jgi:hypothetical protein